VTVFLERFHIGKELVLLEKDLREKKKSLPRESKTFPLKIFS
jgi:hypothetical protein